MKNFRKLRLILVCLFVGAFAMVSCMKDTPIQFQGIGDVMIQDMKTNAGIKYSIFVYVTANQEIQSAKVTAPGTNGKVYQLSATSAKEQFAYIPQASDYTSELPVKGDYSFEVLSKAGDLLTGKDPVGDETLAPIVIKTATVASQKLTVTWDVVPSAEAYVVKLYSADKSNVLFISNFLPATDIQYDIDGATQGWLNSKTPVVNTDYVIELLGIRSETGADSDKANNLQFITTDSKTIKWQ